MVLPLLSLSQHRERERDRKLMALTLQQQSRSGGWWLIPPFPRRRRRRGRPLLGYINIIIKGFIHPSNYPQWIYLSTRSPKIIWKVQNNCLSVLFFFFLSGRQIIVWGLHLVSGGPWRSTWHVAVPPIAHVLAPLSVTVERVSPEGGLIGSSWNHNFRLHDIYPFYFLFSLGDNKQQQLDGPDEGPMGRSHEKLGERPMYTAG